MFISSATAQGSTAAGTSVLGNNISSRTFYSNLPVHIHGVPSSHGTHSVVRLMISTQVQGSHCIILVSPRPTMPQSHRLSIYTCQFTALSIQKRLQMRDLQRNFLQGSCDRKVNVRSSFHTWVSGNNFLKNKRWGRGWRRNINLLFHLSMHSLVDSCM